MVQRLQNWPLLPQPDAQGRIAFASMERSIKESIQIILRTLPGERLMRPGFGGGLERFVNQPNNLLTRRRIRDAIHQAISRWEQRIHLDRVEVWELEDQPTTIKVDIAYRHKRNNVPAQLGITMELEA